MLAKVVRSWGAIGVYALFLGWAAFTLYMDYTAPGRIAPELSQALERDGKANVDVDLPFTPSAFHVQALQQFGTIRRMRGQTILMRGVTKAQVQALARDVFWIDRLRLSVPASQIQEI
ncbi:hypothetical protein [Sinorhizobium meliloti]|uniref:hypothetical protein n=1 Tax=Rhizobium meliloti TaxID=382 RepID=UPI0003744AB8|nr:hypothetical protein [Sinorhizobium meliloti]